MSVKFGLRDIFMFSKFVFLKQLRTTSYEYIVKLSSRNKKTSYKVSRPPELAVTVTLYYFR